MNNIFVAKIQKRGAEVIAARKMSSAMSAAKAAGDHMRDWWFGTKSGEWVSMGVVSDGSYGIPKDIVFSFPVTIKDKHYEIVQVSYFVEYLSPNIYYTNKCQVIFPFVFSICAFFLNPEILYMSM